MSINQIINPTGYLIDLTVKKAIEAFSGKVRSVSTLELEEEALRQEIESKFLQEKAKVEQELAIARRIDSAEEVEIEEYYDTSGEASLGINAKEDCVTVGASGRGRKVTKRIYKFKGYREIKNPQQG